MAVSGNLVETILKLHNQFFLNATNAVLLAKIPQDGAFTSVLSRLNLAMMIYDISSIHVACMLVEKSAAVVISWSAGD